MKKRQKKENPYPRTQIQWVWDNMKGSRALYVFCLLGTVVYNLMQMVVPYFSSQIVDTYLSGPDAAYNITNDRAGFYHTVFLMVILTILRCLLVYAVLMGLEIVSQRVLFTLRTKLYDKVQRQDMVFFSNYRTGDLMTRLTGDLDAVRHMVAWVIRMIIQAIALVAFTTIYLVMMNWQLAISLLVVSPVIFLLICVFKLLVGPRHRQLREKLANLNTIAQENIAGNRVVKAFAREDYELNKFDEANVDFRETNKKTSKLWLMFFPLIDSLASLPTAILLLVGGLFLIQGSITMGQFVAFSGLIWAISNPMRELGNVTNEFQRFSAAASKIMEIYYSESGIKDAPDAVDKPDRFNGDIEFKNVSFQYADADIPVLEHISFRAHKGQTIAIMGETGCGKTSLIHLIPRFYEATGGEILIDGVNVNKLKLKQLRRNIGLATQDVLLYSDTIDGNIAYGDSSISKEDVVRYAKFSAASEFISKMPEGYDTIVGERGVGLSGGQKQRISLARALAIRPSILILDDTTSAVDMETEKAIQESLKNLDFECTKIIIAQRISTTKDADQILIMQHGEITEMGTHEELIKKNGYYAELVKLQAGLEQ